MCLEIITRNMWNAVPSRPTNRTMEIVHPARNVIVTATYTKECQGQLSCALILKALQDKAMRFKYLEDIYYNFLIGGDGKVYEGRGFIQAPCLSPRFKNMTYQTLYIAYIGGFSEKRPSVKIRNARYLLVQHGISMGYIHPEYHKIDLLQRENIDASGLYRQNLRTRARLLS
ncbi:peptidoglycan-recognition protein SB2-like [Macrosteles quadrilineatus]|uniref:peptidoglycan-recognition protein SB2-like n=1 Tax=Macrosteles quadrilineatus TaxID=74068 RepID=UPI0023E34F7B|nr:peptidoglycan-recognition protein SB2-like [Macrosteles quadrilineatus]XP_054269965.1 peptidoglycan-recognition protein SB2-like [Macrosteles quadrilineatus]